METVIVLVMSNGAPKGHTFQGTPDEATDD
jgi:hypothetical protein